MSEGSRQQIGGAAMQYKIHYDRTFEFVIEDLEGVEKELEAQGFEVTEVFCKLYEELSKKATEGTLTETEGRWTSMYLKSNRFGEEWWSSIPTAVGLEQQHVGPVNVRGRETTKAGNWTWVVM